MDAFFDDQIPERYKCRRRRKLMNANFDIGFFRDEYLSTLDIVSFTCMMKGSNEER
jgi:hypothetical protein